MVYVFMTFSVYLCVQYVLYIVHCTVIKSLSRKGFYYTGGKRKFMGARVFLFNAYYVCASGLSTGYCLYFCGING